MSNVVYSSGSYTKPVSLPPTFMDDSKLGKRPIKIYCNNCSQEKFTHVESKITKAGWMWGIFLCILLCNPLFFLLVCCLPRFKEYSHYCKSCKACMGVYRPEITAGSQFLFTFIICFVLGIPIVAFLLIYFYLLNNDIIPL